MQKIDPITRGTPEKLEDLTVFESSITKDSKPHVTTSTTSVLHSIKPCDRAPPPYVESCSGSEDSASSQSTKTSERRRQKRRSCRTCCRERRRLNTSASPTPSTYHFHQNIINDNINIHVEDAYLSQQANIHRDFCSSPHHHKQS